LKSLVQSIPLWNHDLVKISPLLISNPPVYHNMSEYDGYEATKFMLIRAGVDKILESVDKSTLEKIDKKIEEIDIDIEYCCEHPDVLCSILKIACGKSYVELIRSISDN